MESRPGQAVARAGTARNVRRIVKEKQKTHSKPFYKESSNHLKTLDLVCKEQSATKAQIFKIEGVKMYIYSLIRSFRKFDIGALNKTP